MDNVRSDEGVFNGGGKFRFAFVFKCSLDFFIPIAANAIIYSYCLTRINVKPCYLPYCSTALYFI